MLDINISNGFKDSIQLYYQLKETGLVSDLKGLANGDIEISLNVHTHRQDDRLLCTLWINRTKYEVVIFYKINKNTKMQLIIEEWSFSFENQK